MSRVIRYCKLEEKHSGENSFDISRPNPLGNPYTHIKSKKTLATYVVKNRDEAIALYSDYFDNMLRISPKFRDAWDKLYEAYQKYDIIYIGCYCHRNENCHGDIIIKKLKQRAMKEMIDKLKKERAENSST